MLTIKAHQGNTKKFEELTYAEQAKSINAMTLNLFKAVKAHLRETKNKDEFKHKFIMTILRAITRLDK